MLEAACQGNATRVTRTFCVPACLPVLPTPQIDAAARVLDPMVQPLIDAEQAVKRGEEPPQPPFGKFFKDYHETEW